MHMDNELFKGWVSLNYLTDGETRYWEYEKSGKIPVSAKGMTWLTLIPDDSKRCIGAYIKPDRCVSAWYVDVIEETGIDEDGIVYYIDKYLDVILTPQGDIIVQDRDELDAAYESGELSAFQYEEALKEGELILKELAADIGKTEEFCLAVLAKAEEMIAGDIFTIFLDLSQTVADLTNLIERTQAKTLDVSSWSANRAEAIRQYLLEHPEIKRYVVLTDCFKNQYERDKELHDHVVFVEALKGVQMENLMTVCEIMNMKK
jgi:predicted RNA-binding protein associated with RNAse of E/G family